MSEANHSSESWTAEDASNPDCSFWYIRGPNGFVAMLNTGGFTDKERGERDLPGIARLFAASPELLRSCEEMAELLEADAGDFHGARRARERALAIIAKVKGGA